METDREVQRNGGGKGLSYCGDLVFQHDKDRFLTVMTAKPASREALFALYAFNLEVSKTAGVVSEPMLGQIRLQWWREAIEECFAGIPRRHAVVQALASAISETNPSRALFDTLIEGREADLDFHAPQDLHALEAYARVTAGGLTELALEMVLGGSAHVPDKLRQAGRNIGCAWALVGLMRALPFHMRARRGMLPLDIAERHGLSAADLSEGRNPPELALAVQDVCLRARELLAEARGLSGFSADKGAIYGALSCGVLADSYLKQLRKVEFDVFNAKLAAAPPLRGLALMVRSVWGGF